MDRTHVSETADAIVVEPREQLEWPDHKPHGFWYEVDGDWRRWCESEQWGLGKNDHLHRVELGAERILSLTTPSSICGFTARFGAEITRGVGGYIDWQAVAQEFDGIEIAPYQWKCRLDFHCHWYYSWDCASGCIWRPSGVCVSLIGALQRQFVK